RAPSREVPRSQLTEKGPGSGAMGTVSGALGPEVAPDPPSGAPTPSAEPWLQRMLVLVLKASGMRVSLPEAAPVTVLLLQRYMAEGSPTLPSASCPAYYYDVTITDGTYQEKCFLAPQLNALVQRNGLGAGRRLKITQCSYMYNERSLSPGFVCIEELEILEGASAFAGPTSQLGICHTKTILPLKGGRKHYLPLWNNDDPFGEIWVERKPLREDEFKPISISILAMTWQSKCSFPPLRVRIIHKSRLRYFGKPNTKLDVPYQAYFDVADQSGMVLMVLWGSLCPEWYNSMKIGAALLLEKYAVKKSSIIQSSPEVLHMKRFNSIEIALNVRDPPAKINIIPEHKIKPEWKLPEVEYHFVTRSELDNLAQNQFCDIIGLVQYVGRVERKKKKGCVDDFWTYRWVHVVDGTSEQPFIIELFSTSQPDIFEQIYPMKYLVCTQMRVEQNISENGSSAAYLTTSMKTQMFFTGWHKGQPYIKDPKVQSFIQWMRTQEEASYVDRVVIGGYYRFPPLPRTFAEYCKNMNVLISLSEIEKEIDSLHYREQKHIAFQGIISAVRCVSCSSTSQDAPGESPMQVWYFSINSLCFQSTYFHKCCAQRYLKSSALQMTFFILAGNEEIADTSEKVHPQRMCPNSWESVLWTFVKSNLTQHLNFSKIFPESFPCKFNYAHKEVLLKQYNLQAAKFQPEKCLASEEMSHFENACPLEYYQVAILGVNHDIAIEVALLNDSYLFQVKEASQKAAPSHLKDTTPCQEALKQGGLSLPGRIFQITMICHMAVVPSLKISNCKWS
uniref:RPA1 related single stranded DNA binding protein, X-linked n=1 Tax=Pseudonaja textilis TaxID=8673 RepID=A0A670ZXN4_PSETE